MNNNTNAESLPAKFVATGTLRMALVFVTLALFPLCFAGEEPGGGKEFPPGGVLHKNTDLLRLGPEVAVRGKSAGVPVYAFGYSYVLGVSPDFTRDVRLQQGNSFEVTKISPRRSWEIRNNKLGATPPRLPRTARSDFQPLLEINLIDGDPETYWGSRGMNQPDFEPTWFRIDLAKETTVSAIVLVPRADRAGLPQHITVKLSRDGWHWNTVFDNSEVEVPEAGENLVISVPTQPAKQVWVVGQNHTLAPWQEYAFSIAEVQVLDQEQENVALITRGGGVTASSFESFIASQRETHRMLWPAHYELGVKWIRINYAGSVLNWRVVEREEGVYEIDPEADAAVTESVRNGCQIIFGLGFTNWLYAKQEKQPDPRLEKQLFQTNEYAVPHAPATAPGMLEGFKNFVRFMVSYYKDRVDYYEIMNEQSGGYGGWSGATPQLYVKWVKEVAPLIKQIDPGAKVCLGSLSGLGPRRAIGLDWLRQCLEEGVAPYIDGIGWHGYYGAAPDSAEWRGYRADVEEAKKMAAASGFRGDFLLSEWCNFAPYPNFPGATPYPEKPRVGLPWVSELVKANHMARFAIMNLGLDVMFFWNETWADGHVDRDVGLFRNTFSASPMSSSQPQPAFYVLRTLSTVFESAAPVAMDVEFSNRGKDLELWTFQLPSGERLVSVCLPGNSSDDSADYLTDIRFPNQRFNRATGVDTLNGTERRLILSDYGDGSALPGVLVKDFPIVIRLSAD